MVLSGVTRSGLIFGALAFFTNLALGAMVLHLCAPVFGVVWGVAAGIASVAWSDENDQEVSVARKGGKAGAIAGVGAFLGLAIGLTMWFNLLGGQQDSIDLTLSFARDQGWELLENGTMQDLARISLVGATCCFGTVTLVVLAISGAMGAYYYDNSRRD